MEEESGFRPDFRHGFRGQNTGFRGRGRGRGRGRNPHDGEHQQSQNTPPAPDFSSQTPTAEQSASDSNAPLSAGLAARLGSGDPSTLLDLHSTQEGISEQEQAMLREFDIERILNSIRLLGYDVPTTSHMLNSPAITFFDARSDPICRLLALVGAMHTELNRLSQFVDEHANSLGGNVEGRRWREEALTKVFVEVVPALGVLSERVGRQAAASLDLHNGGLRFDVGGRLAQRM